ncbi:hypothetical protein ACHAWF_013306 [Thalassiosira exigua]
MPAAADTSVSPIDGWEDMPFGADFLCEELMEMYSSAAGEDPSNLGPSVPVDARSTSMVTAEASSVTDDAASSGGEGGDDGADHPGILVALHAAAMDGGLSPLGSTPQFHPEDPAGVPEDGGALPPYPTLGAAAAAPAPTAPAIAPRPSVAVAPAVAAARPAPAPAEPAAAVPAAVPSAPAAAVAAAPKAAAVPTAEAPAPASAAKRPAAAPAAKPAAAQPAKKRKGGATAAPKPAAKAAAPAPKPVVKAAPAKVTPKPGAAASGAAAGLAGPAFPSLNRVVSSSSVRQAKAPPPATVKPAASVASKLGLVRPAALPKRAAAPPPPARLAVVPKSKAPGIAHQVVARPAAVPSSGAFARAGIVPPAPAFAAAAKAQAARAALVKKPVLAAPAPHVAVSATGVIRAKSEADFKDVASAAVSSLIQNASGVKVAVPKPHPVLPSPAVVTTSCGTKLAGDRPVDTSTAHVNALTSQNWVTACAPLPGCPIPPVAPPDAVGPGGAAAAASACDKAARNARRAALTQEERARQNRDRNREHARNTRLRKKAYVEELKRTLTELVAQRDAADLERRHAEQREREQREVRFRVVEEFLRLRGRDEPNAARWVAILEDGFALTLPPTPFRGTVGPSSGDVSGEGAARPSATAQVLRGAVAAMQDSRFLSAYLQTLIGNASGAAPVSPVQLAYRCDRKHFFMDGPMAFLDFDASTSGLVARGACAEVVLRGSARAHFSPASNKLISVDLTFDAASFQRQAEAVAASVVSPAEAAAAAAHEADALLDSLQVPHIFADKREGGGEAAPAAAADPAAVSSDDGERSMDGSTAQFRS